MTRHVRRLVALTAVLLLPSACGQDQAATQGYVSGDGVIEQVAQPDRKQLPRISGQLLDGGSFDSDDYTGRVVVYNVWGSWCPPCREEASDLQKTWEETKDDDVQFVGIVVKDNDAAALAFEREFGITYPSINSEDSAAAVLAFSGALPPNAVPSTVVVDRQGRVAARVVGKSTYSTLRALVGDVLAEGSTAAG
jgi:thiol-disulfide isomerase/thioredoxin